MQDCHKPQGQESSHARPCRISADLPPGIGGIGPPLAAPATSRLRLSARAGQSGPKARKVPEQKGPKMHEMMQPLIHKAALRDIALHVGRTGLSIGDEALLHLLPDGRIGVFVRLHRRLLGLLPRRVTVLAGTLGPQASALIGGAVDRQETLRIRIVGLTPEHLASEGMGPEIHVSVWGDPRHLTPAEPEPPQPAPPEGP